MVEYLDRIVPYLDSEIRRTFQRTLEKQGFKFKLGYKVLGAERKGDAVTMSIESVKGEKETLDADVVLVAAGRRPYSKGLGIDELGIKTERGRVTVDKHFRTNVPSVFAIGDLIEGPMLAHKAEEDGVAAVELMAGKPGHVNYETVPGIIYTSPEVATVGKSEDDCKAAGIKYKVRGRPTRRGLGRESATVPIMHME